jgi:hypothetical protein
MQPNASCLRHQMRFFIAQLFGQGDAKRTRFRHWSAYLASAAIIACIR